MPNFSRKMDFGPTLVHSRSVRCQHNFNVNNDGYSMKFVFVLKPHFFTFKNSRVRKLFWSYQAINLVIVEYSCFARQTFISYAIVKSILIRKMYWLRHSIYTRNYGPSGLRCSLRLQGDIMDIMYRFWPPKFEQREIQGPGPSGVHQVVKGSH